MGNRDYNVYARLSSDGADLPISSFTLEAPDNQVGAKLSAELANPVQAEPSGRMTFELGFDAGFGIEWVPMMDVGKVTQFSSDTGWQGEGPSDVRSIQCSSRLADKWDMSPAFPTLVYDPAKVDPVAATSQQRYDLVDESFAAVPTVFVAVPGLDLAGLMRTVYVDKLGFSDLVTNIPTYPLDSVTIGLGDTYHAVVMREIGAFDPYYHADDASLLWIIDPRGTPPPGQTRRTLGLRQYAKFSRQVQRARLATSAVLSYRQQVSTPDPVPRTVTETVESEGVAFGAPGWQRTVTTKFILDFHDDPSRPGVVSRSEIVRKRVETTAPADGLVRLVGVDDQQDNYTLNYGLKEGYHKEVQAYCKLPGDTVAKMRLVYTEDNKIGWAQLTSVPGEYIKQSEVTETAGVVLKTQSDPSDDSTIVRQSLFKANKLRVVPADADGVTVEEGRAISSRIDFFSETGFDQVEVNSQTVDHLNPQAPADPRTFQHTGTIRVNVGSQQTTVNMLVRGAGWTATGEQRPPLRVSAGNAPFYVARPLVDRALSVASQDPTTVTADLAGLDVGLMRGSLRDVVDRLGEVFEVFVTGYRVTGSDLGTDRQQVSMSLSGKVNQ
jgi:hypothetical protein